MVRLGDVVEVGSLMNCSGTSHMSILKYGATY